MIVATDFVICFPWLPAPLHPHYAVLVIGSYPTPRLDCQNRRHRPYFITRLVYMARDGVLRSS